MEVFRLKTNVVFGLNSLSSLEEFKDSKIFIVSDPFIVSSKIIEKITKHFKNNNYHIFSEITPDPQIEIISKGVDLISSFSPDVILAIGGGSAIDAAKAISHFYFKIENKNLKFIAIPTTSGTGSEVTSFSVITDKTKGIKYPLVDDCLLPDLAILDSSFTETLPKNIIANTGMDVLTHALEAYVSTNSNDFSNAFAEKSISYVFKYLFRVYDNPKDIVAREKLHIASCMAGIAFDSASLGINHSLAHTICGKFSIPHGQMNAMLLPHVFSFNSNMENINSQKPSNVAYKYAEIARICGFGGSNVRVCVKNLLIEIKKLQKLMNMPIKLTECNIAPLDFQNQIETISENAMDDICTTTNPRTVTKEDLTTILKSLI